MPSIQRLNVYVPTRGRINLQFTMKKFFLQDIYDRALSWLSLKFVVPSSELVQFRKTHPWTNPILVGVPDKYKFGSVCQSIAEGSPGMTLLLDDDMGLIRRRNPKLPSQRGGTGTLQDSIEFFARIKDWMLKGYAHGGVSLRQSNHFCRGASFKTNTRACGVTFFDANILKAEGIRFDAVQARSDFHTYLSLLELGYHNVVDYEFTCGQHSEGSNAPGGCATYRTPEFQLEQAKLLQSLHASFVKLVYKDRKGAALNRLALEYGIPDVRVSWSRALGARKAERKAGAGKVVVE